MSNSTFITVFRQRIGLRTISNKKYCLCGTPLDIHGKHFLRCSLNVVRNAVRNSAHKHLKIYVKEAIHNIIKDTGHSNMQVLSYEPAIDRYFPKLTTTATEMAGEDIDSEYLDEPTQTNSHSNSRDEAKRADIVIINGAQTMIIDVTMTEATAKCVKPHDNAEDVANQAAVVKFKKYCSTHNMTNRPNVQFHIASTTTEGALSKGFKKLLKDLVNIYPANIRKDKLQQIYQRLSSQIHKITSDNILYALDKFGYVCMPDTSSQSSNRNVRNNRNSTTYLSQQSHHNFISNSQLLPILPSILSPVSSLLPNTSRLSSQVASRLLPHDASRLSPQVASGIPILE